MFPFDMDDEDDVEVEEAEETVYREYELDFRTGQLTGRVVEGIAAVRVWVYLALRTARYHYEQYSWDYGSEFHELIGDVADPEYIELEAQRMAEECLMQNPYILGISEFECEVAGDSLKMKMTVDTKFGEVEVDA
ncbi:MAG: DUF2634 domain-containing protein [Lachnospiraceae bacterium]|nr:DUF2634 domain-containing protein [Lachnospiraceae bacterium]MCI8883143.1 DUF2634 domain-containing protein [Lachnospiraceae bacterium]